LTTLRVSHNINLVSQHRQEVLECGLLSKRGSYVLIRPAYIKSCGPETEKFNLLLTFLCCSLLCIINLT